MKRVTLLFGLAVCLAAPVTHAALISAATVGESFTIDWMLEDDDTDPNGNTNHTGFDLTAQAIFTLSAFNAASDYIELLINITNTTVANNKEIGLWKMGFGTDPNATSVTFFDINDGEFKAAVLGAPGAANAFPDSAYIDVTTTTGTGTYKTLQSGEWDEFLLRIGFADLAPSTVIDVNPFNVFFQSNPDSFQFASTPYEPPVGPPNPVPTPETLMLLLGGLLAFVGVRRRRAPNLV